MRIDSFKKLLENTDAEAYLVTDVKSVYYFTDFRDFSGTSLNLLISRNDDSTLLVPSLSLVAAKENATNCIVKEVGFGEKMLDKLIVEIKDLNVNNVYFDRLFSQTYLELTRKLDIEFTPSPELVFSLRRVKDENELEYIKKASELAVIGVEAGIATIKPGVKEYEVAAEIEYAMRAKGSNGTSFETVVASGPRSAYPHGMSSSRVINEGDLVTIDLGAIYEGYCSDITRTVVAGRPSPEQLRLLNLVFSAQEEAFQVIRSGITAKDVDASARKVFKDCNYEKYFIHGLGHGIGLDVHEIPVLSPSSDDILEKGEVITNEPGIYIEGFGGIRLEDMVFVCGEHGEKLTVAPYYF